MRQSWAQQGGIEQCRPCHQAVATGISSTRVV